MTSDLTTTTENQRIEHDRYEIDYNDILGRGCWGEVIRAKDNYLDRQVAIKILSPNDTAKKQMEERKLDTLKAMQREAGDFAACSNIVPRWFEIDKKGIPFLVMPIYKRNLAEIIEDDSLKDGSQLYLNNGLGFETVLRYLIDISNAYSEAHKKLGRVHGDGRPENFFEDDNKNLVMGDWGTSTVASVDMMSNSPRDNMGFLLTRAPENFKEGSHPTKGCDVYSFGALATRLFTGKYPLEEKINGIPIEDVGKVIKNLDEQEYSKIINRKILHAPKKFRGLLRKALSYYNFNRFEDGEKLKQELEKVVENLDTWKMVKNHARKWGMTLGIPLTLAGLLVYGAATYEPKELTMPNIPPRDVISPGFELGEEPIRFDRERLDLPKVNPTSEEVRENYIKLSTDNKYVAYLMKRYLQAVGRFGAAYVYNETQEMIYHANTTSSGMMMYRVSRAFDVVAKSIEYGLSKSKTPEGTVDLEDACAISRLGIDKVNEARRASESFEFKNYIGIKDKNGNYIIPEKDQEFLKQWLANIN